MHELEKLFSDMHEKLKKKIDRLSAGTEISVSDLRQVQNESYALTEEVRGYSTALADQYSSYYSVSLAGLRIKARVHVLGEFQDLTSLSKYRPDGTSPSRMQGKPLEIPASVEAHGWEDKIDPEIVDKVRKVFGTYLMASEISKLAGYTTSNFYSRIKGHEIEKKGDTYLIDDDSVAVIFGAKRKYQFHGTEEKPGPSDGKWMTSEELMETYDFSRMTISRKVKDLEKKRDGGRIKYHVTDESIFTRKRRKTNEDHETEPAIESKTAQDTFLDYRGMLEIARPRFGDKTDSVLAEIVELEGKRLEVEEGKFSKNRLERAIEKRFR